MGLDTRSKLSNRREKASAGTGSASASGDVKVEEDTRDMEALLAALGEPTKGKTKKKGSAKAAATKADTQGTQSTKADKAPAAVAKEASPATAGSPDFQPPKRSAQAESAKVEPARSATAKRQAAKARNEDQSRKVQA